MATTPAGDVQLKWQQHQPVRSLDTCMLYAWHAQQQSATTSCNNLQRRREDAHGAGAERILEAAVDEEGEHRLRGHKANLAKRHASVAVAKRQQRRQAGFL
eukprot:366299-Chlamydomonas_euryale.AAC.6